MWWKNRQLSICSRSHGQFQDWEYVESIPTFSAQLRWAYAEDVSLPCVRKSSLISAFQLDVVVLVSTALLLGWGWKTDRRWLYMQNFRGWASAHDIPIHIWTAKMQTCRKLPLARIAFLSQNTKYSLRKAFWDRLPTNMGKRENQE